MSALNSEKSSRVSKLSAGHKHATRCLSQAAFCEALETRRLLSTIAWTNRGSAANDSDGFNAVFGSNATQARFNVDRAIADWEEVITNFNYNNGGNTFIVHFLMENVGGSIASGAVTDDRGGKPTAGTIRLDNNAATHWVDPSIGDDAEFTDVRNAFTGFAPTGVVGTDLYATAIHELGHVLGFTMRRQTLTIVNFLQNTGIDDPNTATAGNLWSVNIGGGPIEATVTEADTGHLWEGPGTAASNAAGLPFHPDVLMNPGRAIAANERNLISDFEAILLQQVYGYTIKLPSTIDNMLVNSNHTANTLTVNEIPGGSIVDIMEIKRSAVPTGLLVTVADPDLGVSYSEIVPISQTDSITVNSGSGNDIIRLEDNAGKPTTLNGGTGDDIFDFSLGLRNLGNIAGNTNVSGGTGSDQIYTWDDNVSTAPTFTVTSARFDRPGWGGFFYNSDVEFLNLTTGTGADTVNVQSTFANGSITQPVFLFSAGGSDTVNIGNSSNGVRGINAEVTVHNNPSTTTLNINNGPDTGARTWNVDGSGNFGYLIGMAPARIWWDNADISSINLTCGSGLDTGQFVISTETFNVNNTGGNDSIRIGVPAAQGLQLLSGQITIDNTPATTALSIDDTGSSIARTLTIDEGGGYNTVVGFGPLIRFDNADTNTTIITGSASDTVNVLRNDDTLVINSSGGNDVVNIGNATNGVQAITGELTVRNTPSTSTVNINNGPDTVARTVGLQNVTAGSDTLGRWTGLAPAFINYRYLDVSTVNVTFGSAADSILIRQTQKDLNLSTSGGIDAYAIGGSSDGAQSILGNITLQNPPSRNNFHVDNLGDTTARTAILDDVTIGGFAYGQLTGLAPATISWKHADTTGITLTGGGGADRFYVNEFKSGNNLSVFGGNGNDELHFGNGNLAANILVGTFNFDGQGGSADKFVMENALAPSSEGWNYGVDGPGLSASRVVGGVYNLVLPKQNVEQSVFNGNSGDENMVITAVAVGESFAFSGGAGADGVFLPVNVSTAIRGPITLDGGAGPGNTISQTTNSSAAATTLHVTANTIGAHAGDNFFGAGGSVQFSNFNSAVLTMGTGADTVYVRPNTTTTFNIRGGNPGTAPGDRLNFATAGVTNPVFSGNAANGNLTSSNFARVDYSFFETGPTVDNIAPAGQTATANINGAPPAGGGANRFGVDVTFNDNVAGLLTGASISVLNVDTELTVPAANIAAEFVTASNTARFTFPGYLNGALPDGNYQATASGNLTDLFGNPLTTIPSVSFFIFAGDANRDRAVNIGDFSVLAARFNQPGTFTQGDFNYNGITEIGDFSILASKFNSTLPAPSSLPATAPSGGALAATASPMRTLFSNRLVPEVLLDQLENAA